MLLLRVELLGQVDARGSVRFNVDHASTVRGMNGEPIDVVVENFSRTGFLFEGDVDFPVGSLISVGLAGSGAREATVMRREGRHHGCEFLVPLPMRELENAFRSREQMVADIEARLSQRSDAPIVPEEVSAKRPRLTTGELLDKLKRLLDD